MYRVPGNFSLLRERRVPDLFTIYWFLITLAINMTENERRLVEVRMFQYVST